MQLSYRLAVGICLLAAGAATVAADLRASRQTAASRLARAGEAEFRDLYKELVEIDTTLSSGSCTRAVSAMKARLLTAGYTEQDVRILVPPARPKDGNLIALLPGSDATLPPVMLLAHIDVVEAKREDWERDPFKLTEENGYFHARGVVDDKAMAAIFTDAMIRYKQERFRPRRGIKLALTCGEETPNTFNGVKYLLENHRALMEASFALNEGGSGRLDPATGAYQYNGVQVGEKLMQDFTLETVNQGGHSSRPVPDNAIYRMAQALEKVRALQLPVEFNDTTRAHLTRFSDIVGGAQGADMKAAATGDATAVARLEKDPSLNAMLRTTCVATMIDGGHALNALPQRVSANINCRIFPGRAPEQIRQALIAAIADPNVKVTFQSAPETAGPPPELTARILEPIEQLSRDMFPGVPVVPSQSSGATDGRFLTAAGIPTYGISGVFADGATSNAHGLNERVLVQSVLEGREFLYRLTKMYADAR
jgi:acetylornithine deacetylase/succinyl-diaminopimelate desuccinylase-like protein